MGKGQNSDGHRDDKLDAWLRPEPGRGMLFVASELDRIGSDWSDERW
jgi:hypothetical protein